MPPHATRVLVAGGGPVGLFAALLLGRAGLDVRLFDENATLQEDPRATALTLADLASTSHGGAETRRSF